MVFQKKADPDPDPGQPVPLERKLCGEAAWASAAGGLTAAHLVVESTAISGVLVLVGVWSP